jgi:hypothetical protein
MGLGQSGSKVTHLQVVAFKGLSDLGGSQVGHIWVATHPPTHLTHIDFTYCLVEHLTLTPTCGRLSCSRDPLIVPPVPLAQGSNPAILGWRLNMMKGPNAPFSQRETTPFLPPK